MPEDEEQRVRPGAYGARYDRLSALKSTYDPDDLFRHGQTIRPGA